MSKKITNKLFSFLKDSFTKKFEANQLREYQYVVEYRNKIDDSLIGYHLSTFCEITDDRLSGKRYSGDNPYDQIHTIHTNLKNVLGTTEEDTGMFAPLKLSIKKAYFEGLTIDDIYLQADYIGDGLPPQKIKFELFQ